MSAAPRYQPDCIKAYHGMAEQESSSDFFVCALGDTNELTLVETGLGGMQRVKEILADGFQAKTAVAMFRVTAVDDRESASSYRTKLIMVIYTGPKTPVVKRAKVGTFHGAFKQPFTQNLTLQTDDLDDLDESSIERSLRASGGAHAPSRYDFTNSSAPGQGGKESMKKTSSPSSPSAHYTSTVAAPVAAAEYEEEEPAQQEEEEPAQQEEEEVYASLEEVMAHHGEAFHAFDVAALGDDYTETSELVLVNASSKSTIVYRGVEEIKSMFEWLFSILEQRAANVLSSDNGDQVAKLEWECAEAGIAYAADTFVIIKGKIVLQTVVVVDA